MCAVWRPTHLVQHLAFFRGPRLPLFLGAALLDPHNRDDLLRRERREINGAHLGVLVLGREPEGGSGKGRHHKGKE